MKTSHIVFAMALIAAGCSVGAPGATVREPVSLLAGLRSYETPGEIRAKLPDAEWNIRTLKPDRPSNVPKYEKQIVEIAWRECEQDGTLILTFVNERLYITTFLPADLDACLKHLTTRGIIGSPNPDQRIRTEQDARERSVSMTDTRLEAEIDAWISRYS